MTEDFVSWKCWEFRF